MVVNGPSRYGADFDALASRWSGLEREHDIEHPDRSECGGVGGCSMMARAHDLMEEMKDSLTAWRREAQQ